MNNHEYRKHLEDQLVEYKRKLANCEAGTEYEGYLEETVINLKLDIEEACEDLEPLMNDYLFEFEEA